MYPRGTSQKCLFILQRTGNSSFPSTNNVKYPAKLIKKKERKLKKHVYILTAPKHTRHNLNLTTT